MLDIYEKQVLSYSLKAFDIKAYIENIIVDAREEDFQLVNNIIYKEQLSKKIAVVLGGNARKKSVYNCIKNSDSDIVIIRDGARPVIKQEYIDNCIESMEDLDTSMF